jgi:cyclohexadienyl dehydratase
VLTDDVEADVLAAAVPDASRLGPLTRDRKAYLARDPTLAAELDAWLRAREADGTLAELRAEWFGASHQNLRSAFDSDLAALLALIDLRLALMPAVAAAKETAGLPVEDPAQEDRVIARVRTRARARDLTPESVEALFRAQLTAARAAEEAFLATPRAARPPVPTLDLQREARPALAAISDVIVERAGDLVAEPDHLARVDAARLAEALDGTLTPHAARLAIARAVVTLCGRLPASRRISSR